MHRINSIVLLSVASLLSACGGDMSDLEKFIDDTKSRHIGRPEIYVTPSERKPILAVRRK